jgi:hypothetical protein
MPRSIDDLDTCVRLYQAYNEEAFLPSNFAHALATLQQYIGGGAFFRIVKEDDVIVGWILAKTLLSDIAGEKMLYQTFYASDLKGIKAVRAVRLTHDALVRYALKKRIKYVVSQGSHLDEDNTFSRILEKHGWLRRGHTAAWRADRCPTPPEAPAG